MTAPDYRLCVAPMMDWTDRHCRVFHRLMAPGARLYSEMVTADAIIHGDRERLIGFSDVEHPVALQLGGSNPDKLAEAALISEAFGYDEINLNVGCPSDRVQVGRFGACLMAEPDLVGDCVAAMRSAVDIPVTVKCRIGIDEQDSEEDFARFIDIVSCQGCSVFLVHARKAWLSGLSPRENRDVPPLDYERVYRLKQARPDLTIVVNGGITSVDECRGHLSHVDGVMLGRAAYQTPYLLAELQSALFDQPGVPPSRADILKQLVPYVEHHLGKGGRLSNVTRHVLGLFHGQPRGRLYRRHLSTEAVKEGAGVKIIAQAIELVSGACAPEQASMDSDAA